MKLNFFGTSWSTQTHRRLSFHHITVFGSFDILRDNIVNLKCRPASISNEHNSAHEHSCEANVPQVFGLTRHPVGSWFITPLPSCGPLMQNPVILRLFCLVLEFWWRRQNLIPNQRNFPYFISLLLEGYLR